MSILQTIQDNPWIVVLIIAVVLYGSLAFFNWRRMRKAEKRREEERKARVRTLRSVPGGASIKHAVTDVINVPADKRPYSSPSVQTSKKEGQPLRATDYDDALSPPVVDLFRNSGSSAPPADDYSSSHHSNNHSSHDYGSHSSHDSSSSSHDSSSHDSGGGWDSGGGSDGGGSFGD